MRSGVTRAVAQLLDPRSDERQSDVALGSGFPTLRLPVAPASLARNSAGPPVALDRSGDELGHDGGCSLVRGTRRRVLHTAVAVLKYAAISSFRGSGSAARDTVGKPDAPEIVCGLVTTMLELRGDTNANFRIEVHV
jgi:hypothetical protein